MVLRIALIALVVGLLLAGCTGSDTPVETHSAVAESQPDAAPAAVAEPVVFTPVEPASCEAEASTAEDPAERRADEKTEDAWSAC